MAAKKTNATGAPPPVAATIATNGLPHHPEAAPSHTDEFAEVRLAGGTPLEDAPSWDASTKTLIVHRDRDDGSCYDTVSPAHAGLNHGVSASQRSQLRDLLAELDQVTSGDR